MEEEGEESGAIAVDVVARVGERHPTIAFPAKPTSEEVLASDEHAFAPNAPLNRWRRDCVEWLMDAMSDLTIGDARLILDMASKGLEAKVKTIGNAAAVAS